MHIGAARTCTCNNHRVFLGVCTYALAALNMLMYGGSDSIVRPIFHWRIDPAICAHIFAPATLSDSLSLTLSLFLSPCPSPVHLQKSRTGGTTLAPVVAWILLDLPCYWVLGSLGWVFRGFDRIPPTFVYFIVDIYVLNSRFVC